MDTPAPEASSGDILNVIRARAPDLSRAHQQIAEMILRDPQWSVQSNVEDLAARAGVAKPTIVRFARAVGCDGLKDLKLKLAGSLALGTGFVHRAVRAEDDPEAVIGKVVAGAMSSLAQWRTLLDWEVLEAAAETMYGAGRIDCYGTGATSSFIASDLQARLFRLGHVSTAYSDAYLQLVAAMTLGSSDAVVAISFVGVMPTLLESVRAARAQGARVIAITRLGTPLADLADLVRPVDAPADPTMPVGVEAYVTQLVMIEILSVLVGRLGGPQCERRLERIHKLLKSKDPDADESSVVYWGWKDPGVD
jgi:DNA-binding MurR/RpiR family transcriptional regulator